MFAQYMAGLMGPGAHASSEIVNTAFQLGKFITAEGWITLKGDIKNSAIK